MGVGTFVLYDVQARCYISTGRIQIFIFTELYNGIYCWYSDDSLTHRTVVQAVQAQSSASAGHFKRLVHNGPRCLIAIMCSTGWQWRWPVG